MEGRSIRVQRKSKRIFLKRKFTALIMQVLYDVAWKCLQDGTVKQSYSNLHAVLADYKAGIKGARFIKADNFGDTSPDQFITNKNLKEDSFSQKDLTAVIMGIHKMLKKSADVRHFGMLLYAGHGMIKDGFNCFMMNQFDED